MFRKHRCWMETSIWRTGPQKGIKWKGKILDCHKFAFIPSELGLKEIYSGPHLSKLFRGIHIWRNVSVVFLQNKIEKVEKKNRLCRMERLKVFLPQHITHLFFGWWKEREGGFYVRCLKNADSVPHQKYPSSISF